MMSILSPASSLDTDCTLDPLIPTHAPIASSFGSFDGQNVRLASELTGWNLNVMSKDDADDKNAKEEEETATKFQNELNVDNDVAKILAEEGFTSISMKKLF